jgi:hypothetical protein
MGHAALEAPAHADAMSNSAPRTGNRVAVVLSVAALIMSVGFAGGPAIARALNADTVDHKHAVGSKASTKQRKGKLVATDKRTGRLPDNIIATAPNAKRAASAANADRLAGQPATAYQTRTDADQATNQIVHAGGLPTSTALPAAGVQTSAVTFTTTKPGRLLLDFTGSGQLQCPSSNFVQWWIQLDGTPVMSSRVQLGEAVAIGFDYNGFPAIHTSGVTADVVGAGEHTMLLAGGCNSGANGGSATSGNPGVGTITVLASGFTSTPSARAGRSRTSCVQDTSGRTCR